VADLSLADGVCLTMVATADGSPMHGWQLVRMLAPDGDIGRIWTLSRPLTYRSLDTLEQLGYLRRDRSDATTRRQPLIVTAAGHRAAHHWLDTPAAHIRDLRTAFLVKCELRRRANLPIAGFARRQQVQLDSAFAAVLDTQPDPDDIPAMWRFHNASAARAVLNELATRVN
jgi:DNA-binding MarR family transcriptional regulator